MYFAALWYSFSIFFLIENWNQHNNYSYLLYLLFSLRIYNNFPKIKLSIYFWETVYTGTFEMKHVWLGERIYVDCRGCAYEDRGVGHCGRLAEDPFGELVEHRVHLLVGRLVEALLVHALHCVVHHLLDQARLWRVGKTAHLQAQLIAKPYHNSSRVTLRFFSSRKTTVYQTTTQIENNKQIKKERRLKILKVITWGPEPGGAAAPPPQILEEKFSIHSAPPPDFGGFCNEMF